MLGALQRLRTTLEHGTVWLVLFGQFWWVNKGRAQFFIISIDGFDIGLAFYACSSGNLVKVGHDTGIMLRIKMAPVDTSPAVLHMLRKYLVHH